MSTYVWVILNMSAEAQMFSYFSQIWDQLPRIRELASSLESPNAEDDQLVKIAIAGYSYHQPVESWGRNEFDFVKKRRDEVAGYDSKWIEFVCAASGYLLSLYQSDQINDTQCFQFKMLLPGYMWQHSERFTSPIE